MNSPHIITVLSGKGGVGKTTTCLGVALALKDLGRKVAILDLDLENPSIGAVCGLGRKDLDLTGEYIEPPIWSGIKVMSLSLLPMEDFSDTPTLVDEERKYEIIQQLHAEVNWGESEFLVVDMPPGSGEEVRGLLQLNPEAAIIVTSPQKISEAAVKRVIVMAHEYAIPILGLIQNNVNHISGEAGERLAGIYNIPLLAQIGWRGEIIRSMEANKAFTTDGFEAVAQAIQSRFPSQEVITPDLHYVPPAVGLELWGIPPETIEEEVIDDYPAEHYAEEVLRTGGQASESGGGIPDCEGEGSSDDEPSSFAEDSETPAGDPEVYT